MDAPPPSFGLSDPLFSLAAVTRITRTPMNRMRVWLSRGYLDLLRLESSQPAQTHGKQHYFTFRNVMVVALMLELHRLGLGLKDGFEAAERWMAFGEIEGEQGSTASRTPGGLYDVSSFVTLLAYSDVEPKTRIIAMPKDDRNRHVLTFGEMFPGGQSGVVIVNVNKVWHETLFAAGDELAKVARRKGKAASRDERQDGAVA